MNRSFLNSGCALSVLLLGASIASAQSATETPPPPATANTVTTQDAMAQQASAPTSAAPASQGRQVDEIIVTAQRRSENLVNVPVAVTVLSSTTLSKQAISEPRDLQLAVPGLTVRAAFNSDQLNYAIRGQTIDPFTNSQPGVLPYTDEYQVPTGYTSAPLYDLDSIQVLKGPQGTLFGRNAIGGAVLVTTAQPTFDLNGYAKTREGDYGLLEFEGAVNVPVSDWLAVRVAGRSASSGGYFRNLTTGKKLGNRQSNSLRGSVLIKPFEGFSNTIVADYNKTDGTTTPGRLYSEYPLGSTNNGVALSPTGPGLFSPQGADATFGPGFFEAYIAANGLAGTPAAGGLTSYFNSIKNDNPNSDVRLNSDPTVRGTIRQIIDTATYKVSDEAQLKSIVGYTHSKSFASVDADGTPFLLEAPDSALDIKQYSAELQLSGKALSDNLQYVFGGYYFHSSTLSNQFATVFSFAPVFPPLEQFTDRSTAKDEEEAVYAQGTYSLSSIVSGLEVTGGVRYTHEVNKLVQDPGSIFYGPNGGSPEQQKLGRVNYQGGVQYHLTSRAMLYGKVSTSFRSGGFNSGAAPVDGTAAEGGNSFNPEKTISYEIGAKFEGRLVGAPVRFNVAAFHQIVDNVQRVVYVIPPGGQLSGLTANVPQARINGVEADGYISPAPWLQLGANAAFIYPKFTENTITFFGQTKMFGPYPDTPKISGSVYAELDFPLAGNIGNLSIRGDGYHQTSNYFSSLANTTTPGTKISAYTVANFRVALEKIGGSGFTLATYLKNAFNEKYYVGGIPLGEVLSLNTAVPGAPRTWFIEASIKF